MSVYDYRPEEPFALPETAPQAVAPPLPPPPLGRVLPYALLCGFVGFLVGLRLFAAATLPHILTPDGTGFQSIVEGLPIPRLLDWNTTQIAVLQEYADLNPLVPALGALLLFGFLWIRTLALFFPSLRLFHPLPELERTGGTGTPTSKAATVALDDKLLRRMAGLFFWFVLPIVLLWSLEWFAAKRFPTKVVAIQAVEFIAVGVWLRAAFRPGGFVARGLAPFGVSSERERTALRLPEIFAGALFGVLLFLLQRSAMRLPAGDVLRSLHALGSFHVGRWNELALHYLLSVSLAALGTGLLFVVFASRHTRPMPSLPPLGLVALCAALSLWLQRPYSAQSLRARWDITAPIMRSARPYSAFNPTSGLPDGVEAAKELARLTGIAPNDLSLSPDRRFLLFTQNGAFDALQHGYTEDGLSADLATVPKIEAFLRKRSYNTALSWTAFKHLYNVGNVNFDSTLALRACLDDLENSPHAAVMTRTVREMLFTVAASPQNLALLDEWADDGRFDHVDRPTLKLMGDLYLRFGEQQKALDWYGRADMPRSFMAEKRANKPLFHAGEIQGAILWNGKPLVGVRVGAFPYMQNGLPKDLEGFVRSAERQLMPPYAFSEKFGSLEPRPYEFRWMSAGTTTDSAGRFALSHLSEGTYHLVCTLPPDVVLTPFQDNRLHVVHAPGDITLRYAKPTAPLGTIELAFKP